MLILYYQTVEPLELPQGVLFYLPKVIAQLLEARLNTQIKKLWFKVSRLILFVSVIYFKTFFFLSKENVWSLHVPIAIGVALHVPCFHMSCWRVILCCRCCLHSGAAVGDLPSWVPCNNKQPSLSLLDLFLEFHVFFF